LPRRVQAQAGLHGRFFAGKQILVQYLAQGSFDASVRKAETLNNLNNLKNLAHVNDDACVVGVLTVTQGVSVQTTTIHSDGHTVCDETQRDYVPFGPTLDDHTSAGDKEKGRDAKSGSAARRGLDVHDDVVGDATGERSSPDFPEPSI
jgi:hypothetical protein